MVFATRTVEVLFVDTIPPVLTLLGGTEMTIYRGAVWVEPGFTAIDNVDGDITNQVIITGIVNVNTIGTYVLRYTVSDQAGNEASATRTVRVIEEPVVIPPPRPVARQTYSFTSPNQARQGNVISHQNIVAEFSGQMELNLTAIGNNTTLLIQLINVETGQVVIRDTFTGRATRNYNIEAGHYTLQVTIERANGNTNYALNLRMPEQNSAPSAIQTTYNFTSPNQARQGDRFTYSNIVASQNGTASFQVTDLGNNTTIVANLINVQTREIVATSTFTGRNTVQWQVNEGRYELQLTVTRANGNTKFAVTLITP
jgi:hypothetical protein